MLCYVFIKGIFHLNRLFLSHGFLFIQSSRFGRFSAISKRKFSFKMDSEVSKYVEIYNELSKIPFPSSALILPGISNNLFCIHSLWNSPDLVKSEKTTFARDYIIAKSNLEVFSTGIVTDTCSIQLQAFSKSGKRQAVLHEKKSPEEKVYLEIWSESRKEKSFDLTDCKEHGKINKDDIFGCFKWSCSEKYLLYTAEAKQPKSVSFFNSLKNSSEGKEKPVVGEEYLFREEWGESFNGIHHPVMCILELETGNIEVLSTESLNMGISVGQCIWSSDDENIVFVGWEEEPYRLGVWACMNRRSRIYSLDLRSKEIEFISEGGNVCARSPCFSPNFDTLIYLQNEAGGPHRNCSKLMKYDWKNKKVSTVIDIVKNAGDGEFPGIYEELPTRCWSSDGQYVFFTTVWRSQLAIVCVNVENGQIQRVQIDETFGSAKVLDVHQNLIVAQVSSPNTEPCLIIGDAGGDKKTIVDWRFLDSNAPVKHSNIKWDIIKLTPTSKNPVYPALDYDIIVISPVEIKEKLPLIIIPHGGPQSCYPATFMTRVVGFVKAGFIVCLVNYRGSIGFGENNIMSLPGNIGDQDVCDVQDAAVYVKSKCNFDISDIFVFGGSHGGFLAAHLIGQYPDFYKAAILLNPVIDISAMAQVSDIPDWCWVQVGCGDQMDPTKELKPSEKDLMWEKSPIKYISKVHTPTLLLLGVKDLRVPVSQGLLYYRILRARKVPVKIYTYEDNHILSKTPINADLSIHSLLWFMEHLSS